MFEKFFSGLDGMVWFVGVVESRQDPLGIGRVKVRCFGIHTDKLTEIPADNLPWASVSHGVNVRNTFEAPHEGDYVWGFFADNRNMQLPIVCGVIPGYPTQAADQGTGFHDLRTQTTLRQSPRKPKNLTYNSDGSGVKITEIDLGSNTELATLLHPQPDELNNESVPQVATGQTLANTVVQYRKSNLDKHVPVAGGGQWNEPYPAFNPLYPYNNATETESGHIFELDDTPGNERIHIAHRNGSFIEWFPSGTRVEKVTKSRYSITMADDHVHIMGKCQITVSGKAQIKVIGDCSLEVGGNLSANAASGIHFSTGGPINLKGQSFNVDVSPGDYTIVGKTVHISAAAEMDMTSGSDMNRQAGGGINDSAGGQWLAGGSYASITAGLIQLNGPTTAEQGGTPPNGATAGQAAGLPAGISAGSPTNATVPDEVPPTPLTGSLISFNPDTGLAFKYAQFLSQNANTGMLMDPGANTNTNAAVSNTNSSPCMFDTTTKTFLSSDAWDLSQSGTAFLEAREGFGVVVSADLCMPYPDPTPQSLAIGYGSHGPVCDTVITPDLRWTRAQAEANLQFSIANYFLPTLQQSVTVQLTQNMVDALLSLMYNIGQSNFSRSTLVQKLNNSDWCGAADQFLVWNKTNGGAVTDAGLTTRRKLERTLFLS